MHEWFSKRDPRQRVIDWLGIDAWIDSSLAAGWETLKNRYDAFCSFFARFHLTGWKRIGNELLAECMTIAAAALVGAYALAIGALSEFDEARIATGKYAVKFLDRNGTEIGQRGILHNDAIPLEEIPDTLIKATLATEDRRFYEHFGIDVIGTVRALLENARANEVVQGGSTLTQQLAKNLFLSSERSIQRKIKEAFLALLLEARFTKRQILKLYLDRAYLGGGAFGVEAASQYYFGKSVREINLPEAALVAGLFKAPSRFAPHVDLGASRARTNDVLTNLVEAGYMTEGQVHAARLNPAKIIEPKQSNSPDWYLDWAFEEAQRLAEGRGQYVLTARSTVDLDLQQKAQQALVTTLRPLQDRRNPYTGALVTMEPDGAVRALVGGLNYEENQFNRAVHAHRQPGSSFKLYVYTTAFENGFTPNSLVHDYGAHCGNWSPRNYSGGGGSGGSMRAIDAFRMSLNVPAVALSLKVGRDKILEMTRRLGVTGVKKTCSMALGDTGIAPIEHTGAFATFANGGKSAKPYAIYELFNSKGELLYSRERDEPPAPQVVSRRVVEMMNQMMKAVVDDGTSKRAALDFTHAVGKSGTSSSWRDAWFVGFTGALVTGVWMGHDNFRPMPGITGGNMPATIWHNFMSVAHGNRPIPPILGVPLHPNQVAEQARFAELHRSDARVESVEAPQFTAKKSSLMPEQTREVLKRLSQSLRRAAGLPAPASGTGPGSAPSNAAPPEPKTRPGAAAQRRVEVRAPQPQ
jgi:penicillin-binding protein 1A